MVTLHLPMAYVTLHSAAFRRVCSALPKEVPTVPVCHPLNGVPIAHNPLELLLSKDMLIDKTRRPKPVLLLDPQLEKSPQNLQNIEQIHDYYPPRAFWRRNSSAPALAR